MGFSDSELALRLRLKQVASGLLVQSVDSSRVHDDHDVRSGRMVESLGFLHDFAEAGCGWS